MSARVTCKEPLLLLDHNRESLGRLLAPHVDHCSDGGRGRRVPRSEGVGDTLVCVAEEITAMRKVSTPPPIKGVGTGVAAAVGGIQAEVP